MRDFRTIFSPFEDRCEPGLFYESRAHRTAFSSLCRYATDRDTVIGLVGDAGAGKTLLIECVRRIIGDTRRVAYLSDHMNEKLSLVERVGQALDLPVEHGGAGDASVRRWAELLLDGPLERRHPLVVIDDAGRLPDSAKWDIGRLFLSDDDASPFTVVVVGDLDVGGLLRHLGKDQGVSLRRIDVDLLTRDELRPFLEYRWSASGARGALPFSDDALASIWEQCGGNPRRILQACGSLLERRPCSDSVTRSGSEKQSKSKKQSMPDTQKVWRDTMSQETVSTMDGTAPGPVEQQEPAAKLDESVALRETDTLRETAAILEDVLSTRQTDIERACESAEQIESNLAELVTQLADVGDSSQEKVCQLLDSIEAGVRTREELERSSAKVVQYVSELDQVTAIKSRHLEDVAASCVRKIQSDQSRVADELTEQSTSQIKAFCSRQEKTLAETMQQRLAEVMAATETGESRLRDTVDHATTQIKRTTERMLSDLEPFGVRGEHTRRLSEAVDRGVQDIEKKLEKYEQRFAAMISDQEQVIDAVADRCSQRFEAMLGEKLSLVMEDFEAKRDGMFAAAMDAHLKSLSDQSDLLESRMVEVSDACIDRVTLSIEQIEQTVKTRHLAAIEQSTDLAVRKVQGIGSQQNQQIEDITSKHRVEFDNIADVKIKQLASQLSASKEAVRMVSGSTQEAQATLSALLQKSDIAIDATKQLTAATNQGIATVAELGEVEKKLESSMEAADHSLQGSQVTIEKIERLIQDVWTLTSTAQNRGRQLSERIERAGTINEEVSVLQDEIATRAAKLADQNQRARTRQEELGSRIAAAEDIVSRLDNTTAAAAEYVDKASDTLDNISARHLKLGEVLPRADQAVKGLQSSTKAAASQSERLLAHRGVAEEILERLAAETPEREVLVRKLEQVAGDAGEKSKHLHGICEQTKKLRASLIAENQACRENMNEVTQLLATLVERREILENGDQSLHELLDRAALIGDKIRQLQTRADAFDHQLNSMLADPRKIIDEAKIQSKQLDSVCKAVRKVFAGLSQVSLNANRDVTRFTEVSREANARLAQLTTDTDRSSQVLREWVEEAVHAQQRLSKSIAKVPTMDDRKAKMTLDDLSRTSASALPSILDAPERGDLAEQRRNRTVRPVEGDDPTSLASLIREAEEVAGSKG